MNLNPMVGLWLIIGLVVGLFITRRAAVVRRKRRLQRHAVQQRTPRLPPRITERAEMRAYEDPSTLARDITTTGPSSSEVPVVERSGKER